MNQIMKEPKMANKEIFVDMQWDEKKGKKKPFFGKVWGDLKKGNATAMQTGDGLVVIDIDTKDLTTVDKKLVKLLSKFEPTTETARGFHWYFKDKDSNEFTTSSGYSEHVDVRTDGGLIFTSYTGDRAEISYKQTGAGVHKKMGKKLREHMLSLKKAKKKVDDGREPWSEVESGQIHDVTLGYAINDFKEGLTYEEVLTRAMAYCENYNSEVDLMLARVRWAHENVEDELGFSKDGGELVVKEPEVEVLADIDALLAEEDADKFAVIAELAKYKEPIYTDPFLKKVAKRFDLSVPTVRAELDKAINPQSDRGNQGVDSYFRGEIIWDSYMGVFVQVCDVYSKFYTKANFGQTLMSLSGWMQPSDVSEALCTIPCKNVLYRPDEKKHEIVDKYGDPAINVYRGVAYEGKGKKCPKLIDKILTNLFLSQPEAKEVFINWLAYIVQTGKRTGIAWGFFGEQTGTGKGFIVDVIERLLGEHNCSLNLTNHSLQSPFNAYAYNKQFVHFNEIASDYHERHGVAGYLKTLITDAKLQVNQKGITEISQLNFCNVILNSNKPNPIELEGADRRWNMIATNVKLTSYDWWTEGVTYDEGLALSLEFGAWLMTLDVDVIQATTPMELSEAKQKVISMTSSPLAQLGKLINDGGEGIIEHFEIDADTLHHQDIIDNVNEAIRTKRWCNKLLCELMEVATNEKEVSTLEMNKRLKNPHLNGQKVESFRVNDYRSGKATSKNPRGISYENVAEL